MSYDVTSFRSEIFIKFTCSTWKALWFISNDNELNHIFLTHAFSSSETSKRKGSFLTIFLLSFSFVPARFVCRCYQNHRIFLFFPPSRRVANLSAKLDLFRVVNHKKQNISMGKSFLPFALWLSWDVCCAWWHRTNKTRHQDEQI